MANSTTGVLSMDERIRPWFRDEVAESSRISSMICHCRFEVAEHIRKRHKMITEVEGFERRGITSDSVCRVAGGVDFSSYGSSISLSVCAGSSFIRVDECGLICLGVIAFVGLILIASVFVECSEAVLEMSISMVSCLLVGVYDSGAFVRTGAGRASVGFLNTVSSMKSGLFAVLPVSK
ncbi:hypothetical protein Tco_0865312 [Tanacetum coccineum]